MIVSSLISTSPSDSQINPHPFSATDKMILSHLTRCVSEVGSKVENQPKCEGNSKLTSPPLSPSHVMREPSTPPLYLSDQDINSERKQMDEESHAALLSLLRHFPADSLESPIHTTLLGPSARSLLSNQRNPRSHLYVNHLVKSLRECETNFTFVSFIQSFTRCSVERYPLNHFRCKIRLSEPNENPRQSLCDQWSGFD